MILVHHICSLVHMLHVIITDTLPKDKEYHSIDTKHVRATVFYILYSTVRWDVLFRMTSYYYMSTMYAT